MSIARPASQKSAEERPIGMRTRSDLLVRESVYQGETCWIVKDPLAMKYFRLREPEYLVFRALENETSYQELKQTLDRRFPEKTTRIESVQQLVVSLHRSGLMLSESTGQTKPLEKRRNKELMQKAMGLMSSLIALRLPGFDPEWILNFLYPKVRWFFTLWFTAIVALTCSAAGLLVLTHWTEFYSRLPEFQSFFAFENLLFMGAILIVTKTIHEFGHGLMCKHFGGECHEIGFMFLVMTPAMYCNTSDSWVMPNRWHRIAIGAAGMYVEIFLAALCTFIWWYTKPGWIHYLALNVMFLSSVSTIVFNANPLLRYDGYFILSDLLEIPNLAQKSKQALLSRLRVFCLGMKPIQSGVLPERHQTLFAIYSVASFLYRWFVLIMIFWFLSEIFEPMGLAVIGHILIAISLTGMVVVPMYKMIKFFLYPGRLREVKKIRAYATTCFVLLALGLFLWAPLPHFVWGHFVVRPKNPQLVVVKRPGVLTQILVKPGEHVTKGQPLAVLENPDLKLEYLEMVGEKKRLEVEERLFILNRAGFPDAGEKIAELRGQINELEQQIIAKDGQIKPLVLKAERDGIVIPPPNVVPTPPVNGELPTWGGTPLDPENLNSYLAADTLFCYIGTAKEFETVILIDQSDLKLVQSEQPVKLVVEQFRDSVMEGTVSFVAQKELEEVPRELSQTNGGPVAVKPTPAGEKPLLKLYEVKGDLAASGLRNSLLNGCYGVSKIRVGKMSLAGRTMRYLQNLINFR